MIRPRHIGAKMLLAMCVPLVALSTITWLQYQQSDSEAAQLRVDAELARAAVGPGGLIERLQEERSETSLALLGLEDAVDFSEPDAEALRAATDAARARFVDGLDGEAAEAFTDAVEGLATLDAARERAASVTAPPGLGNIAEADTVFAEYTIIIDGLLDGATAAVADVDDSDLHRHALGLDLAARASELDNRLVRHLVLHAVLDDLTTPGVLRDGAALATSAELLRDRLAVVVDPALADDVEASAADRAGFDAQVEVAVTQGIVDIESLLGAADEIGSETRGLGALRATLSAELDAATAGHLGGDQQQRTMLLVALIGLAAAQAAALIGSRTVTKPLRRLVGEAELLASDRLPAAVDQVLNTPTGQEVTVPEIEQITVRTKDEVSLLAEALNDVQAAAVGQAVEQAVLRRNVADAFVNLGRRNQALVDRQLEFITELQRNEHDPDALDDLFKLDHLATRMRRNAESLLLLAGEEPMRIWTDPIPVVDVVRSALGEVEEYQRVEIRYLDDVAISGDAVADVGHVLAELVENALAFSPSDRPVEVFGHHVEGAFRLAVVDHGVGMNDEDLLAANIRLKGRESFTVPPSRYLGHYVTGQLAKRHDVTVRLLPTSGGGITAEVDLPEALLWTPDGTAPAPTASPVPAWQPEPEPAAPLPVPPSEPVTTTPPAGTDMTEQPRSSVAEALAFHAPTTETAPDQWADEPWPVSDEPSPTPMAIDAQPSGLSTLDSLRSAISIPDPTDSTLPPLGPAGTPAPPADRHEESLPAPETPPSGEHDHTAAAPATLPRRVRGAQLPEAPAGPIARADTAAAAAPSPAAAPTRTNEPPVAAPAPPPTPPSDLSEGAGSVFDLFASITSEAPTQE